LILDFVAADVLLTPPSFGHLPYILRCKTPRNAAGHGKGRGLKMGFLCFNSLALLGISLYIVKEILGGVGVILLLL
jgi:hypothetical protein